MVNSVKGFLQTNEDYAIEKTFINIETPAIICLQTGRESAVQGAKNQTGSCLKETSTIITN